LSTEKLTIVTSTFLFNQRSYDFLGSYTFMKVKYYKFLFRNYQDKLKSRLPNKKIYGNIFYEHLRLSIKLETDYYSTRLKLHLVKIIEPEVEISTLFPNFRMFFMKI
jgi:hypothetical protein